MSNIKTLPGQIPFHETKPIPHLVQMLEAALEDARSGNLRSFIGMGFTADGSRMSCFTPHPNVYEFAGGIEWLKRDYMEKVERDQ